MNKKNRYMLENEVLKNEGYDWWWHSFTGYNEQTGEARSFFIEYYIINPGLGEDEPVYGQLRDEEGKRKPSYAMIKAGCWGKGKKQLHNMYAINQFTFRHDPFRVQIGHNILENLFLSGQVKVSDDEAADHPEYMSESGSMSWSLMVYKEMSYDVGYGSSEVMRDQNAFDMYWHVEGLKSEFDGYVDMDGERYLVTKGTSHGYQDKNWGKDYTSPWIWLNCNRLKAKGASEYLEDAAFVFGGGRPVVFGKALEGKILGVLNYGGEVYEYNFSKLWKQNKQSIKFKEEGDHVHWLIKCQNCNSRIALHFKALKEDLILANYENPLGEKRHNKLYNGGTAEGELRLYKKKGGKYELEAELVGELAGCEYGEY